MSDVVPDLEIVRLARILPMVAEAFDEGVHEADVRSYGAHHHGEGFTEDTGYIEIHAATREAAARLAERLQLTVSRDYPVQVDRENGCPTFHEHVGVAYGALVRVWAS